MNKQAPSASRIIVMAGFALSCFGLLLYLWLAFGGPIPLKPKGYRFDVSFREAQQLAEQADVRISGVPIGKVQDTVANKNTGTTVATLEIEEKYAPVPKDTRAVLRQKTLLGETYVELTPGTTKAGMVAEGGSLPVGAVSPTVEVDEVFRTFNPQQRRDFQIWMQQLALASRDRGSDISEAIGNLAPFAEETRDLAKILNAQAPALQSVVRDTGEVFEALTEREGQLRGLVESSDRVFAATSRRAQELREAFIALPTFERESRVTVERLSEFAEDTRPLVNQLRPFARELSPTLQDLNRLAPDLRDLFQDLDPAISASEKGLPAIDSVATELRKTLPELTPLLKELSPNVEGFGRYLPEIGAFFANAAAATNAYDVDDQGKRLHYLRVINPIVPENLATYQKRIGSNRTLPYIFASLFGGAYAKFEQGLDSFETRHCGRPDPILAPESVDNDPIDPAYEALIPRRIAVDLRKLAFGDTPRQVPAPACTAQVLFPTYGVPAPGTKYPQLRQNRRLLGGTSFSPRPADAEPPPELTEEETAAR